MTAWSSRGRTDAPVDVPAVTQASDAFQQQVSLERIDAMCRRAFGDDAEVVEVTELSVGTYNSTYRIDLAGQDPVVLRVAPEPGRQARGDREAMRNEYAAAPYLAGLGALVPRILAVDFTHQLLDRDYMFQTLLAGVPASTAPTIHPSSYYRQLGAITRAIHDVRGTRFGRVANPAFATWSDAVRDHFTSAAVDFDDAGLDSGQVHHLARAVDAHEAALNDVAEPRLLHGDLWQLNILVETDAAETTITGVLDHDRASWGDPLADWTIDRVRRRPGAEAFWETYGHPVTDAGAQVRDLFYQARHLVGVRLDIHRRGIDITTVPPVHWDLGDVLARLDGERRTEHRPDRV
jgi:aminoglycoside phosphotransferase (APT) family kinase protein